MKKQNLIKPLSLLIVLSFVLFTACDKTLPTASNADNAAFSDDVPESAVKPTRVLTAGTTITNFNYPISTSKITTFKAPRDMYNGNAIDLLPTNSVFDFGMGSLTPPPSIPWGDSVQITFSVDRDFVNNELIFSFGPHGCQFNPAAQLILDYSELGISTPTLYYIADDGTYIEHTPDYIDVNGRKLTLYIDHFSRYAVAYGR